MPGSTTYSMAPVGLSGVSKTAATTPTLVSNPITAAKLGDAYTNLPEVYKTQDFNEQNYRDKLLTTKYGTEASRRDKRKFNRYMQSEEGLAEMNQAKQAHIQSENQKWSQSLKARSQAMDQESARRREAMRAEWDAAIAKYDTRNSEIEAQDLAPRIEGQSRFNDAFRLARQAGLDTFTWKGKLYGTKLASEVGNSRSSKRSSTPTTSTATPAPAPKPKPKAENPVVQETPVSTSSNVQTPAPAPAPAPVYSSLYYPLSALAPNTEIPVYTNDNTQTPSKVVTTKPIFDFSGFGKRYKLKTETVNGKKYLRYDPPGFGDFYIGEDGAVYTVGAPNYPLTYKDIPESSAMLKKNAKILFTMLDDFNSGKTKEYDQWYSNYLATHPKPAFNASLAGSSAQTEWNKAFASAKAAAGYKQGGRFKRVSYFQQGGAAPQQDIEAQITALVQAAMQGDQNATQQVNQILEAAKAGDQQAMQIAQMIQQVVEQMQGQATSAKWGTKLGYIKSLKYAKGGKTCPACEKKVEMKACGGKKAKKRYFGGLI